MAASEIRIHDLVRPELSPIQKLAIEAGGKIPVDFGMDAVLDQACRDTGLNDFGAPDFKVRLAVWFSHSTRTNDQGQFAMHGLRPGTVSLRLRSYSSFKLAETGVRRARWKAFLRASSVSPSVNPPDLQ